MSVFVTNIASMIGIGVAVDYSLFVLARYREEIRGGGGRDEARRIALRTSGLAVTFSGVTVMLSLAGLYLVDSTTIRSMAMGAIIVVAISILAAVTLLPVLMSVLGRRAYARGRIAILFGLLVRSVRTRRRRAGSTRTDAARAASGSAGRDGVTAHPWVVGAGDHGRAAGARHPGALAPCSATARCASSPRTTRRASAPSWRRRRPGRARPVPSRRSRSWTGTRERRRQPQRAGLLRRAAALRPRGGARRCRRSPRATVAPRSSPRSRGTTPRALRPRRW